MLSDHRIRQALFVDPEQWPLSPFLRVTPMPDDDQFQPASLDLKLGNEFAFYKRPTDDEPIDPTKPIPEEWIRRVSVAPEIRGFLLHQGEFVLGTTLERITVGKQLVARVEGKSSLGRIGLMVHVTAGFIDPGFEGNITLEMTNLSSRPIVLVPGMKICQLSFSDVDGDVLRPYGHPDLKSKYQGQVGVTPSRLGR